MPDSKVSALPAAAALDGTELVPLVQGSVSKQTPLWAARALSVDYTTTQPPNPATGLVLFSRQRARRLPSFVGPTGQDSALQPALFANRVARWNAVNNSATPTLDGLAVTNVANPTLVQNATTSFYTAMVRARFASAATAGAGAGMRSASAQWFLSTTANLGGLFMVCRWGLNLVTATNRGFVGMSATTGALAAGTQPSAYLSQFGFGWDSTHTTMRFMHNDGTGTATQVDLGANFPVNRNATDFYETRLFVPSAAGQVVYWSALRLNDGSFTQGTASTDLPALNALLSCHVHHSNGTTAAAVNMDVQSLYIETDN